MDTALRQQKLEIILEQIRKVQSTLTVCRQLNQDPNASFNFRNDLATLELYVTELAGFLGLGTVRPFAQTQFNEPQLAALEHNLIDWQGRVEVKLDAQNN